MRIRRILLSVVGGLALWFVLLAVIAALGCRISASELVATDAQLPVQTAQTSLSEENESTGYVVRTVENEVCIFQNGELLLHTGVNALLLPQQDREALEIGITAPDEAALTALLEDLGS